MIFIVNIYFFNSTEFPKEFEKTSEVLPFTKYGVSSLEEFQTTEKHIQHLECLKKAGLTNEEIILYQENESGILNQCNKVESSVLRQKLDFLYSKIQSFQQNKERYVSIRYIVLRCLFC